MHTQGSQSWDLSKHSRCQGLHTHTKIYKFLNIVEPDRLLQKYQKRNRLLVYSNQRLKIGFRTIVFRKTTSIRGKCEREQNCRTGKNHNTKPKREGFRLSDREKFVKVQTRNGFLACSCMNVELVFPNVLFIPICEGS